MGNTTTVVIKVKKTKAGKGSRKIGRNKNKCLIYKMAGRREKNKARKIKKDAKFKAKKAAKKLTKKGGINGKV